MDWNMNTRLFTQSTTAKTLFALAAFLGTHAVLAQTPSPAFRVHAEQALDFATLTSTASDWQYSPNSFSPSGKLTLRFVPEVMNAVYAVDAAGAPPRLVVRIGDVLPEFDSLVVRSLGQETIDNAGIVRIRTALAISVDSPAINSGVMEFLPDGTKRYILSRGTPVAEIAGATLNTLPAAYVACNAQGWMTVHTVIEGVGITPSNNRVIMLVSPTGQQSIVARLGDAISGFPNGWTHAPDYFEGILPSDEFAMPLLQGQGLTPRTLVKSRVRLPGASRAFWHLGSRQAPLAPLLTPVLTLPGVNELALVNDFSIHSVREDGRFVGVAQGIADNGENQTLLVAGTPDSMRTVARVGDVVTLPFGPAIITRFNTLDFHAPASRTTSGAQAGELIASVYLSAALTGPTVMRFVPGQPPQPIAIPGNTSISNQLMQNISQLFTNDEGKALFRTTLAGGGIAHVGWSPQRGIELIAMSARSPFIPGGAQNLEVLGTARHSYALPARSSLADGRFVIRTINSCNPQPCAGTGIFFVHVGGCFDLDFNNDGIAPTDDDLIDYLTVLAGGSCSSGLCDPIDFNNDGVYPSDDDLSAFLRVLAGGSCRE